MTDEEINLAIAEALGIEIERRTRRGKPDPNGVQLCYLIEHHGGVATWRKLSNYCHDLNAMHEAEKALDEIDWVFLVSELASVVRLPKQAEVQIKQMVHATARQRAEAFLRTLGKWKD